MKFLGVYLQALGYTVKDEKTNTGGPATFTQMFSFQEHFGCLLVDNKD